MTARELMLAEARELIGTRFHHQGRVKGVGVDCIGVVVLCCRASGAEVNDRTDYPRRPNGSELVDAVLEHCDKISLDDIIPADFMLFGWKADPLHIAIVSAPNMIIHAYAEVRKVVEHRVDATWLARLRGCYRLKGL